MTRFLFCVLLFVWPVIQTSADDVKGDPPEGSTVKHINEIGEPWVRTTDEMSNGLFAIVGTQPWLGLPDLIMEATHWIAASNPRVRVRARDLWKGPSSGPHDGGDLRDHRRRGTVE
jgi:hypothetical protein